MGRSTAAAREAALSPVEPDRFPRLLDDFRERLDRELEAWIAAKRREAESAPAGQSGPTGLPELIDGVAGLVARGGKRLRPALVYHTYRACGGTSDETALPVAMATELLHTYLLIHDDIMDHAEVRRGQPSAHARFREAHRARGLQGNAEDFGRSVAILLGDLAHTYAVELFLSAAPGSARAAELTRCFSAMCQEVIGGQYLELLIAQRGGHPEGRQESRPESIETELLAILRLKSGLYTADRPIQLGALLAGASPALLDGLSRYGSAVGEAFQLQDDLLGMFGDAGTVGKPVGADLKEGKFTFLIHHALAAASPAEREVLEAALGDPDLSDAEVERARKLLETTGARAAVERMIADRLQAARAALASLAGLQASLQEDGRLFLEGLIDYLRERER